ncbi:apolipoprotein N-acyltransferase [Cloacibacterium normanense]|uniref:Apolipoprotein N-acyltransferase n=1 Tax=Cloacibacterium normanense TaxID=237258 RepID=A0A1E5UGA4_9FLAO|nr:apolipoprotein N-acyltransferase [Cloacibacterium normanense]AZI68476.1 apolipoprotein N-acyltransferase [Cloacibacterium normanense]OEL11936.1 apolipoprotein N-acyltransferase [Cloacibacterium normanense]
MKYIFLSLISALLLSISWPTYGIPFFIFFAFVPLLLMEQEISKFSKINKKGWAVFGLTYLAFFIWNVVTTGWLYHAKNPDGNNSLLAVAIPVIVNSLLMSLVFQLYYWYKKVRGTYFGLVFFVAIWLSFERFHLNWEFTWPWLNLGNAFSEYPQLIQWYDTIGATGGSFWILLINVFAFYTLRIWQAGRIRKDLVKNISILTALIVLPLLISIYKYNSYQEKPVGEVTTLLLQPKLDPYTEKYSKDSLQILGELLNLAEENSKTKVDFFIAPETAFPGNGSLSENGFNKSTSIAIAKDFLGKHPQSIFLTGASTHKFLFDEADTEDYSTEIQNGVWVNSYNSALQIIPNQEVEVYHKAKLVPGVEIFPYIRYLKPILGDAMLDFGGANSSLGIDKERKVFSNTFNKAKMAPIICYESIYGEYVTDYVKNGANLLAIMTNDSWWDNTEGHKQLLSYARLRAIETRREIVRAANSGISAHINARGDVLEDTFYDDRTALLVKANLLEEKSIYTKIGDLISRIAIFVLGFLIIYHFGERIASKK